MVITLVFSGMPFDNCVSNSIEVSLESGSALSTRRFASCVLCAVLDDRGSFNSFKAVDSYLGLRDSIAYEIHFWFNLRVEFRVYYG